MEEKQRQKVNPVTVTGDNSGIQVKPLTGEQKAGVKLAYFLLIIISGVILITSSLFYCKEFDASDKIYQNLAPTTNISDSTFTKRVEQIKQVVQEKKEYREFVTKNFQYILSVLLPILTSILGYIFGTKAKD
jgi:hypothetical protein